MFVPPIFTVLSASTCRRMDQRWINAAFVDKLKLICQSRFYD